ncbi:hypothetical protein F4808DRAFT_46514 [Astrocystis sublimbata]|nr:hypothetical protein F4808DRAFT_46514 [Astrocystis sublimbata]
MTVRKSTARDTKSVKPIIRRRIKRPATHAPLSPHGSTHSRQNRVRNACERCRMKKTKCDGEFPCKRCKGDDQVCKAGTRKKTRGYAEVLQNTQTSLIATVHKLYAMVRNGQSWDLGEPELNDRGRPVIHDIATKLGCMRTNADADMPPHSVFPEDEAGLAKFTVELEMQQAKRERETAATDMGGDGGGGCNNETSYIRTEHSGFVQDYGTVLMSGQQKMNRSPPQIVNMPLLRQCKPHMDMYVAEMPSQGLVEFGTTEANTVNMLGVGDSDIWDMAI